MKDDIVLCFLSVVKSRLVESTPILLNKYNPILIRVELGSILLIKWKFEYPGEKISQSKAGGKASVNVGDQRERVFVWDGIAGAGWFVGAILLD